MNKQDAMLPKDIVKELNKYIIGQNAAKKAIAIAIRNRYRRMQVEPEMREEILPKNILMIGPTGVGKTEIARRMAHILNAPFVKVEATKFTEIGYVGRNVESMVRDLSSEAVRLIKQKKEVEIKIKAIKTAEERIIDILIGKPKKKSQKSSVPATHPFFSTPPATEVIDVSEPEININDTPEYRNALLERLRAGELDKETIEIDATPSIDALSSVGFISATSDLEEINMNLKDMVESMFNKKTKKKKIIIKKALKIFEEEELDRLIDMDEICEEALHLAENSGIIFIDEIDKIISNGEGGKGPNVSREGVQRDFLPIVEGTVVKTRYGNMRTDHILFIAAGAFHLAKPSDLIPELQGRFPIRVELEALTRKEFYKILSETKNSLIKQYRELLEVENIQLDFEDSGIKKIAEFGDEVNKKNDNIGARRLYAIMEKLLEDISFNCEKYKGQKLIIDEHFVASKLGDLVDDTDLSKYIL